MGEAWTRWSVLPWDPTLPVVDREDCLCYTLGAQWHFYVGVRRVRSQLEPLLSPRAETPTPSIVWVQGPSRSGKTTEASVVVPWLLAPHMLRLRPARPRAAPFFPDLAPMFVCVDCLGMRFRHGPREKLESLWTCLRREMLDKTPEPAQPTARAYEELLLELVLSVPRYTIVTLDEFHSFFLGLSPTEMVEMVLFMRGLMCSPDSPCQFVVTGSTSSAIALAAHLSLSKGADLWVGACVVATDTESDERALMDVYTMASLGGDAEPLLSAVIDAVRAEFTYVNCVDQARMLSERTFMGFEWHYERMFQFPPEHCRRMRNIAIRSGKMAWHCDCCADLMCCEVTEKPSHYLGGLDITVEN
eukprot:m51a1_g10358 hypothetical protein (359) ;mRNA; f:42525-46227